MSMTSSRSNVIVVLVRKLTKSSLTLAKILLTFDAYWAFFFLFLLVRQGCFVEKSTCNNATVSSVKDNPSQTTMVHTLGPGSKYYLEVTTDIGTHLFRFSTSRREKTSEKFVDRNFFQPIKFQVFTHFFDL